MTNKNLIEQVSKTYWWLRVGLAAMAFGFPLILAIGGATKHVPLAGSMSAYYHASLPGDAEGGPPNEGVMRNEFVGILFAVGVFLLVYQGLTKFEDIALDLAGVFAFGVALFPMAWPATKGFDWSMHGVCAALFFLCIGYVCIFRSGDSLSLLDEKTKRWYQRWYQILGWAMVILPFVSWILIGKLAGSSSATFFVELAGVYVFAAYWALKSHETDRSGVDRRAARGEVRTPPHRLTDAFRSLPVTPTNAAAKTPQP